MEKRIAISGVEIDKLNELLKGNGFQFLPKHIRNMILSSIHYGNYAQNTFVENTIQNVIEPPKLFALENIKQPKSPNKKRYNRKSKGINYFF